MPRIRLSAFRFVPSPIQGLVRDLRVRWALEEAGESYEELLIGPENQRSADYLALQPFGQVPAYIEGELELFESGAIVLHIAERSPALLPQDPRERARAQAWMFAALNSIEPRIQSLVEIDFFHAAEAWANERRPAVYERAVARLADLAAALGDREYLEGRFTAGDLLMATVLRVPRHLPLVERFPVLADYLKRCEARGAFQRALAAQMAAYERFAPVLQ